jgi:hypothetical protein
LTHIRGADPRALPRRYRNDTGALPTSNFAPVFEGWNVWNIYQTNELDFSIMMIGVSRDRQLRIFVEDALRLAGVEIADSIDLKGSMVEILTGPPSGLASAMRKENLPFTPAVNGPAELRTVRFFNRGATQPVAWPHSDNYLLDEVFKPAADNPATRGPKPPTTAGGVADGVLQPITDAVKSAVSSPLVLIGAAGLGLYLLLNSKAKKYVRRIRNA